MRTLFRGHTSGVAIAGLVATAALLAGCGSSSGDSANGSGADDGNSNGDGASSSALRLPGELGDADTVDVAMVSDYPPMSYMEGGEIVGFHVDLLDAIADVLGTEFNYKDTSFASLIPELQSGRVPMAVGGTTDTEANQAVTTLVDYAKQSSRLTVLPGNPEGIQGLDTACGKKVGALAGSPVVQDLLDTASADCEDAGNEPIDWSAFPSADQSALALTSGRVDATLDSTFGQIYRIENGQDIEVVGPEYLQLPIGIQVAKDNTELAEVLRDAMQTLIDDGTYADILEEHGLSNAGITSATINAGNYEG
jgi:polar amino acid transport system substrate-binding protein